ncbi:coiled-coil domain-containing protein 96-like isoform X2 [Stegostoma tigrinum]|uniref:coiled-coil domain-containing protein 96 isoform X2 n=2 Tax=Stegostoma tigrinum TaxID=3053191 RepID=UPI00202B843B|nr:coiled-coil domain-containing protein 96 isoform X2 [Stegostoma tigrinum]XP_059500246.1 coiled-coil domain-containing protein 96-like isoform X2 [Stegostoma tigrinum]
MLKHSEQQPSPQQSLTKQVPAALIEEEDEEGAAGDSPVHTPTTGPTLRQMEIETATQEPGINPGTPAGESKDSEAMREEDTVSDVQEINLPPPSDGASPEIQEWKGLKTVELKMTAPEETKEMEKTSTPLPTSITFSEGEKEEPPTVIGEDLAHDDGPEKEEFSNGPPIIELGTPERQASPINEEKVDEEVEDEQASFDQMELEYRYQALFVERQTLRNHNTQVQNKLADYYRKKKTEESKVELKKAHSDYEQRYVKFMDSLAKLQAKYREEVESYQEQIADLSAECEEKQQLTEYAWRMFMSRKRSVAKTIINKRPGRHAALLELERIQNTEEQKEKEMRQIRFQTIKMKNKLKYYEHQLKAKEELAGGLNLIDYEQLKIENQSYGEKIEERNEEVTKMRKKIAFTIGMMTHIKEKLEYVEAENIEKKTQLMDLEAIVAQKREILTKTKQARDRVRAANFKLKEKCGLLCNKVLLRDYEDNVDTSDRLQQKLEVLKRQHADLTLDSYGIKKKIEWVKTGQLQTQ